MKKTTTVLALALATLASAPATAYEAGTFIARAGVTLVDPHENSGNVSLNGGDTPLSVGVDSSTQLGITLTYMVTDHIGVGVLGAVPFQHTITLKGTEALGVGNLDGDFADIKHLPPTLSLEYFPNDPGAAFQPYVGVGLNYTTFFSEDLDSSREAQGFSGLSLDDSWGLALEAGMDYAITDNLVLNAAVWYIDIDTEATFDFNNPVLTGGATAAGKVDVDIDPWVYMIGIGYRF